MPYHAKVRRRTGVWYSLLSHPLPSFPDCHFPFTVRPFPEMGKARHLCFQAFSLFLVSQTSCVIPPVYKPCSRLLEIHKRFLLSSLLSSLSLVSSPPVDPLNDDSVIVVDNIDSSLVLPKIGLGPRLSGA